MFLKLKLNKLKSDLLRKMHNESDYIIFCDLLLEFIKDIRYQEKYYINDLFGNDSRGRIYSINSVKYFESENFNFKLKLKEDQNGLYFITDSKVIMK